MESIKEEFHQPIDSIEDETYSQDLFESVATLTRRKGDVLDDLPPADMQRLDNAIAQIKESRVFSDNAVRERYAQWITK